MRRIAADTVTKDRAVVLPWQKRHAPVTQRIRRRAPQGSGVRPVRPWRDIAADSVAYALVHGRSSPATGEFHLLVAVLDDAIRTLMKTAVATRPRLVRLRQEDLAWLVSGDRSTVFAFEVICEALDIDPVSLRRRVLWGLSRVDGRPH